MGGASVSTPATKGCRWGPRLREGREIGGFLGNSHRAGWGSWSPTLSHKARKDGAPGVLGGADSVGALRFVGAVAGHFAVGAVAGGVGAVVAVGAGAFEEVDEGAELGFSQVAE